MGTFLIIHPEKPDHVDVICGPDAWPEFQRLGWIRKDEAEAARKAAEERARQEFADAEDAPKRKGKKAE